MLWKNNFDLDAINAISKNSLVENLGIEFKEIGTDYLVAHMPVDSRTVQPYRLLHGGASVALAETLGSIASTLMIDLETHQAVGVEINANHLSSAKEGSYVVGTVRALRVGKNIHVWNIDITNAEGKTMCVSRITIAVIERRKP
jgi:1,4-dihydroxy-2-naphthoyl-CoA hydrolase